MPIDGFLPVIINIVPITNLPITVSCLPGEKIIVTGMYYVIMPLMNVPRNTGEMEAAEKRRYSRVELRQPIQFQSPHCALERGSLSCDLSEGGARVDLYDFVPLGTELTLRIRLAVERIVEYAGRVVWVRKYPFADRYQAGLEFSGDKTFLAAKRQLHDFFEVL